MKNDTGHVGAINTSAIKHMAGRQGKVSEWPRHVRLAWTPAK